MANVTVLPSWMPVSAEVARVFPSRWAWRCGRCSRTPFPAREAQVAAAEGCLDRTAKFVTVSQDPHLKDASARVVHDRVRRRRQ